MLHNFCCPNCSRLLGKVNGTAEIKCPRCKTVVVVTTSPDGLKGQTKIESTKSAK